MQQCFSTCYILLLAGAHERNISFGFSVGGFLTAATMIYQVCQALNDAEGSSTRCKKVVGGLEGMQQALNTVKNLVEEFKLRASEMRMHDISG